MQRLSFFGVIEITGLCPLLRSYSWRFRVVDNRVEHQIMNREILPAAFDIRYYLLQRERLYSLLLKHQLLLPALLCLSNLKLIYTRRNTLQRHPAIKGVFQPALLPQTIDQC